MVHSYFGGMRACMQCRHDIDGVQSSLVSMQSAGGSRGLLSKGVWIGHDPERAGPRHRRPEHACM